VIARKPPRLAISRPSRAPAADRIPAVPAALRDGGFRAAVADGSLQAGFKLAAAVHTLGHILQPQHGHTH
jgi:hypothetical protein